MTVVDGADGETLALRLPHQRYPFPSFQSGREGGELRLESCEGPEVIVDLVRKGVTRHAALIRAHDFPEESVHQVFGRAHRNLLLQVADPCKVGALVRFCQLCFCRVQHLDTGAMEIMMQPQ